MLKLMARFLMALLLGAILPLVASAMDILDFGRMNLDDESTCISILVAGAAQNLRANGHPVEAQRAIDLFKDKSPQGGVNQLYLELKELNSQNNHNAINPNNRIKPAGVEDALAHVFKAHDIIVPVHDLLAINKDFHPAGPLRSQKVGP